MPLHISKRELMLAVEDEFRAKIRLSCITSRALGVTMQCCRLTSLPKFGSNSLKVSMKLIHSHSQQSITIQSNGLYYNLPRRQLPFGSLPTLWLSSINTQHMTACKHRPKKKLTRSCLVQDHIAGKGCGPCHTSDLTGSRQHHQRSIHVWHVSAHECSRGRTHCLHKSTHQTRHRLLSSLLVLHTPGSGACSSSCWYTATTSVHRFGGSSMGG